MASRFSLVPDYHNARTVVLLISKAQAEAALVYTAAEFQLPAAQLKADFTGDRGEQAAFFTPEASGRRIVLLGMGDRPSLKAAGDALTAFTAAQRSRLEGPVLIHAGYAPELAGQPGLTRLVCAIDAGLFQLGLYKKEPPKAPKWNETQVLDAGADRPYTARMLKLALVIARGNEVTRSLVYEPANRLTPDLLEKRVAKLGKEFGFEVTVFDHKELKKRGMNGILAVGQGSTVPPRLIRLDYKGKGKTAGVKAAFVGKGITFDTGGVSIKDSTNMHYMKSDMAGAAAVIGLFCTLSGTKCKDHIVGLLPVAENMADGGAYRPSDVITTYSGLSIEVLDTDAEGRIVLADALSYGATDVKPGVMIDLATLTGSIITALGYQAAGLFTQNNELAAKLDLAGQRTGERVWRMPLWDDYAPLIASDIADVKNLGGPAGGSISAAKFLERFTLNHGAWAHLDIAGMALQTVGWAKDRVATGYGVALLAELLDSLE